MHFRLESPNGSLGATIGGEVGREGEEEGQAVKEGKDDVEVEEDEDEFVSKSEIEPSSGIR